MLLSSGILVSKCCQAVIYDEDGYHCMKCFQSCEPDGTLGDFYKAGNQRRELESQLARTFVKMQRERTPVRRQELWAECLRLSAELEKLDDNRS